MSEAFEKEIEALPLEAALAFAPIHKRHFGTAIGIAASVMMMVLTIIDLLTLPDVDTLRLMGQYFVGYEVTPVGILIGGGWAFFVGWVAGWFVAFCRNFVLAAVIFWVRTKANIQASRDFLDHI